LVVVINYLTIFPTSIYLLVQTISKPKNIIHV